jgi:hypothetical protein
MTVLKWLVALAAIGYVSGLAVLFLLQRSFLFPIPQIARTAPAAAGFPQAEEHVLTTVDGEKVIVWHVPAKPGRPVVLYFHGNGDFLAGFFGRFRDMIADGTGIVALSYRGYAGSSGQPSEQGLFRDAAAAYTFASALYSADRNCRLGFFARQRRGGGAGGRTTRRQADPGSAILVDCRYCRVGVPDLPGPSRHARSLSLRPAHCPGESSASHHAWRTRRHNTDRFRRTIVRAGHQPKQFVRFPEGSHNDLDSYGAAETARQFIGGASGR